MFSRVLKVAGDVWRFTWKIMNKSKIWQISEQLLALRKIKVLLLIILYVNIDAKGSIPNSVHCVSLVKAFCVRKSGLSLEIIHFKTKTISFFFSFYSVTFTSCSVFLSRAFKSLSVHRTTMGPNFFIFFFDILEQVFKLQTI